MAATDHDPRFARPAQHQGSAPNADRGGVVIEPMRRKHVKAVQAIELQVYPRPWSVALFQSELALRETRAYFVARIGREVVGYAGLMMTMSDGHITTIAVDPRRQREGIGVRLLLVVAREARARNAEALTLEVRLSNRAAQALYRKFGFAPVGVRTGYYQDSAGTEDALIMWAHGVDSDDYARLLDALERLEPRR